VGPSKSSLNREVYYHEHQHQKIREISDTQSDDAPPTFRKTKTSQSQMERWKEMTKN
jgi:hypothetical protein